jgi:hypothetical protein
MTILQKIQIKLNGKKLIAIVLGRQRHRHTYNPIIHSSMQTIRSLASAHFGEEHPQLKSFLESLRLSSIGERLNDLEPELCSEVLPNTCADCVQMIIAPKPDEIRCHAVTYMVRPNERGVLIPKQCIRAKECGSHFCKQHNVVINQSCSVCSMNSGTDTVHRYQWEHLGTIHEPTWIFSKYEEDLRTKYFKTLETQKKGSSIPRKPCTALKKKEQTQLENQRSQKSEPPVVISPEVFISLRQLTQSLTPKACTEEILEDNRIYCQKLKVWYDEDTQLYYNTETDEEPLGQIVREKLVPFRRK